VRPENTQKQSSRERSDALADLRDLKEALQRNGDQPLIPWAKVKKDLELE
jgi:hypothetical protein